jgi:4,5-DOPA dioxygenase extradiol
MQRKDFIKSLTALTTMGTLTDLHALSSSLPVQSKTMPVLFTSHGNPMDIPLSRADRPFWKALYELGLELQKKYELKAALVVSAHWCTKGTYVNVNYQQEQIYDYYGFPPDYYKPQYKAYGAPELAKEVATLSNTIKESSEWGLDHGAWPMLMHLFPEANIPVFQLSIDYYATPEYHYELGKQLKSLRNKGVFIIGSGSLIHNLSLAMKRIQVQDMTPYGWEAEYDEWLKKQLQSRNITNLIRYESSHHLGKTASPTPDHFVPVLYTLGLMDHKDEMQFIYEKPPALPAFSERSFILHPA